MGGEFGTVRMRGLFYGRGIAAVRRRASLVRSRAAGVSAAGAVAWHIDVQWIEARGEFWAVFNAKTRSGCTTPAVFIARSADGVHWTVGTKPVIAKERIPEFEHVVYRSSFDYDDAGDLITFWYSGARHTPSGYVWGAAVERRRREEVFAPAKAALEARIYEEPPAPLDEWP